MAAQKMIPSHEETVWISQYATKHGLRFRTTADILKKKGLIARNDIRMHLPFRSTETRYFKTANQMIKESCEYIDNLSFGRNAGIARPDAIKLKAAKDFVRLQFGMPVEGGRSNRVIGDAGPAMEALGLTLQQNGFIDESLVALSLSAAITDTGVLNLRHNKAHATLMSIVAPTSGVNPLEAVGGLLQAGLIDKTNPNLNATSTFGGQSFDKIDQQPFLIKASSLLREYLGYVKPSNNREIDKKVIINEMQAMRDETNKLNDPMRKQHMLCLGFGAILERIALNITESKSASQNIPPTLCAYSQESIRRSQALINAIVRLEKHGPAKAKKDGPDIER